MIKTVEVSGVRYNVAQQSAIKQKDLMLLVGGMITMNALVKDAQIDTALLVGTLLSASPGTFDKVAELVLYKTVKEGGDSLTTIDDFQGNITNYFLLVAEAVAVNLNDFFTYLASSNPEQAKDQA